MKNEIVDTLEETTDLIEETLDILENQVDRVVTVTKTNPFLVTGVLLAGIGIGGIVAYKIAVKRTSLKYEDILEEQIAEAKEFYRRLGKREDFETPESAVDTLIPEGVVEVVEQYQGKVPYNNPADIVSTPGVAIEKVEVEVKQNNVFVDSRPDSTWDYNAELQNRSPDKPYIISFEEFTEGEEGHETETLAYYVDDDTLTDRRDSPIDDTDGVVGDDNLTRFGHGSHDANVVYVRNDRLDMDFEIIRSTGSYARDVLGVEPTSSSIQHSHRRPNRRRWSADE